ncbi:Gamma-aminobutyric acid receptor subunit beta [Strongyloides ratti]|uniref:Gamma-aminobutyric acid receptor subunit beta n=1 Tax=Strongyloides ratti TaxID=34506 RepID=A0A090L9W2_STRRB|nr:Gamma-aminobutyric acid receptor subunit beta [Strongyloides ratti]CEF66566.1 Gamma-aminobutyric acid receptor subunit beta [Strongyloides ratti]
MFSKIHIFWLILLFLCYGNIGKSLSSKTFNVNYEDSQHLEDEIKKNNNLEKKFSYNDKDSGNINNNSNAGLEVNVTRLLDALIMSHDKRIRPNYGGEPTVISVTAHIITISAISEVTMDFSVDLYLRQFWKDTRLAFGKYNTMNINSLTIGIDMVKSIWTPDTFFPNEKKSFFHETTSHNSFLRIDKDGNVLRSIRLTVIANCPMNLHTFPLDVQNCSLEIESYGYSTADIIYRWYDDEPNNPGSALTIDENVHLAHFTVDKHDYIQRTIRLTTGDYSRLSAFFIFKRNIGFYLIQIYFPSSLIVVISWVSFWLSREANSSRISLGLLTLLSMTTIMTSNNSSLPKVSYVKSLDIFLGVCFFIVFASLLEYAAVGYLLKRRKNNESRRKLKQYNQSTKISCYEIDESNHPQLIRNNNNETYVTYMQPSDQDIPLLNISPNHIALIPNKKQTKVKEYNFKPSQIDLFSRIAFPLFFIFFHIIYWSVFLNVGCF